MEGGKGGRGGGGQERQRWRGARAGEVEGARAAEVEGGEGGGPNYSYPHI